MGEVWAGIVRVSHVGTRGGDSFHADEDQIADIRRYANTRGAEVVFMLPELSVSGGKTIAERPSLRAAIEGVERGEFTGIVVAYLSRLTRSRSGIQIWERVEAAGGHVHCAAEQLDTSTPSGRFVRDIHLANAVREREEHSDRHAKRRQKTVEAGVWRQRQVPLGYTFAGPAGAEGKYRGLARRLVPGDRADEVQGLFRARAAGESISQLARQVQMTPGGVRAILRNRVYLGELRDGGHVNPTAHEPLIDIETFEAAQRSVARPGRRTSGPALLSGIVRCAACGHLMTRGRGAGDRVYYGCPASHSGERCPAPASITTTLVDDYVAAIARRELSRVTLTAAEGNVAEDARVVLASAERELVAYVETVSVESVGAEAFAAGAMKRREAVEAARAGLRAAISVQLATPVIAGDVSWEELDDHERNQVLRGLLAVVIVRRAGGRGARVAVGDRVRVIGAGSDLGLPVRVRGERMGLHPLPFPDLGSPGVLGVPGPHDRDER